MKSISSINIMHIFFMCILIIISVLLHSQSNWNWQNPKPHGYSYYSVAKIPDSDKIISVGYNGLVTTVTENGDNWDTIYLENTLRKIIFSNHNTGFITCADGTLYKTIDSALSWQLLDLEHDISVNDIFFLDETTGFILGNNEQSEEKIVLKTIDSGDTWFNLYTAPSASFSIFEIYFYDNNIGYGTGSINNLFKTIDGGNTWTEIDILGYYHFETIEFVSEDIGFILAIDESVDCHNHVILKTIDGGDNWELMLFEGGYPSDMKFSDMNNGFLIGDYGIIKYTDDCGETWNYCGEPISNDFESICFSENGNYFIVGEGGIIFKSTNNGISWDSLNQGTSEHLNSIYFIDESTGLIAGNDGTILRTTDAGENWIHIESNILDDLRCISFVNENIGFMLGVGNNILKTTDGGNNWFIISSFDAYLFSVLFLNENVGFVAGNSFVMKTVDSGLNWVELDIQEQYLSCFYDIEFINENIGFVIGSGGRLLKTVDGGNDWDYVSSCTDETLLSIYFFDENLGFISGANGRIIRTTDGGNSWICVYYGTNEMLYSIYFVDNNVGYVTGTSGCVLKTINSGSTWEEVGPQVPNSLNSVFFTDNKGYIVGDLGLIMTTEATGINNHNLVENNHHNDVYLYPNYPNPFNPETTISFDLTAENTNNTEIIICNLKGQKIKELRITNYELRMNKVVWDGKDDNHKSVSSGIYFYKLKLDNKTVAVKRCILMK
ncbi:MAG: T9SS type A sorting domain-containing protein [Candidatus Cloacimonetes bacterium]|nr:T9SS type A sorting domain-containing protein [Candidatus Cloacimonadota bacterium]